jgi:[ribosomal protein S5]-alanine N-acetyltransferase
MGPRERSGGVGDPWQPIETERLLLRQFEPDDADEVLRHFSQPGLYQYMDFEPIATPAQALELIGWGQRLAKNESGAFWGLFDKQTGALIGSLNYDRQLDRPDSAHRVNVGYDLAQAHWGRGLMTEAVQTTLPYVFGPMGFSRIETTVHVQNYRSVRVLVKCGFRIEGILRQYSLIGGELADMIAFALLKREWEG